jgi:SAM-dependent methyltransferase
MSVAVKHDIWVCAQEGHFRTWEGYARRGVRQELGREMYWKSLVAEMDRTHPLRPSERVLDLGCGLDTVLDYLPSVRGFTLDSLMHRLSAFGLSVPIAHAAGLFEMLPFADEVFDRVFLMNVLDHVRSPFCGLREIARVLRPGGVLVISVDTYRNFHYHRRKLRKWYDRARGAPTKHPWVFSNSDVTKLLRRGGFKPSLPRHLNEDKDRRAFWIARRA